MTTEDTAAVTWPITEAVVMEETTVEREEGTLQHPCKAIKVDSDLSTTTNRAMWEQVGPTMSQTLSTTLQQIATMEPIAEVEVTVIQWTLMGVLLEMVVVISRER